MEQRTLVLGLAHFVDKYGYQAEVYWRYGKSIRFVTMDISGGSMERAKKYNASIVLVGSRIWARLYATVRQFLTYRPTHVEIYDIGRLTIVYALMTKLSLTHLTIYLIGGELNASHQSGLYTRSAWRIKQFLLKTALLLADLVIAKEEHMREKLQHYGIDSRKIHFIGNAVPLPKNVCRQPSVDFLYLNAVIRQRHVDVMVGALELLQRDGIKFSARIVGFSTLDQGAHLRDPEEERRILAMIEASEIRTGLELLGYSGQPFQHYEQARFFILPGEVIYANYALLEAMSYGVIPIVYAGEGANRIVSDGVDGFIFRTLDAEGLCAVMRRVFAMTERDYEQMSKKATEKMRVHFSIDAWYDMIMHAKGAG